MAPTGCNPYAATDRASVLAGVLRIGCAISRKSPRSPGLLAQQHLDLCVDAAQLVGGPALERRVQRGI